MILLGLTPGCVAVDVFSLSILSSTLTLPPWLSDMETGEVQFGADQALGPRSSARRGYGMPAQESRNNSQGKLPFPAPQLGASSGARGLCHPTPPVSHPSQALIFGIHQVLGSRLNYVHTVQSIECFAAM